MKKVHSKWLPFEEARAFVHTLHLRTFPDWLSYCRSGKRPKNIPFDVRRIYKNAGWKGSGDWLGTGFVPTVDREYRSFEEARAFIHTLNLKNHSEWREYCQSGKKPPDIPYAVASVYKDKGWLCVSDWLGNGNLSGRRKNFLSYKEARTFVHNLNLKGINEWKSYCKSGKRPNNIPANPDTVYRDKGWLGIGDWLGTGRIASRYREFLPFELAKEFVINLKLKDCYKWKEYCKSGLKPDNIPSGPYYTYKDKGWSGYGDWLGTGRIGNQNRVFLPFEEAKKYVHKLKLKNTLEWKKYLKSGLKPDNIPSLPSGTYKDKGWSGMRDWLGTKIIAGHYREFLPFEHAKKYVHNLKLKNTAEWINYSKSGLRPKNIPSNPHTIYKDKGWSGINDWLGTSGKYSLNRKFLPYEEAKEYVHNLKLKKAIEWTKYSKSGLRPKNIPSNPSKVYKYKGWSGIKDWLGTKKLV